MAVYFVQDVETLKQDASIWERFMRLWLEYRVKNGHQIHLMCPIHLLRMTDFRTAVVEQQRTTAAILIRRGQEESGAIQ